MLAAPEDVSGPSHPRPLGAKPALLAPPPRDAGMVAGEENVRHLPPAELRRPRVVRILEPTFELRREALETAGLLGEGAREPARDRVHEHHRRQLAAGEDVASNRDRVRGEVGDD